MTVRKEVSPRRPDVIKDYIRNLNDDDWRFLKDRLSQRLGGDLAEAVIFMEKTEDVNHFLESSSSATDYFNRLDHIEAIVQGDAKRRAPAPAPVRIPTNSRR